MPLDISKLENVVEGDDGNIVARCPACAEQGADNTGNHLIVFPNGKFGCAVFPGQADDAKNHRKAIYRLAGSGGGDGFRLRPQPWTRPPRPPDGSDGT